MQSVGLFYGIREKFLALFWLQENNKIPFKFFPHDFFWGGKEDNVSEKTVLESFQSQRAEQLLG